MLSLYSLLQRRTVWSIALLTSAFAVPAVAQTHADAEHAISHRQQVRAETSQEHDTSSSSHAATPAAQPRITSDIKSQPQAQLTGDEKQALSQAAARLLVHVDKAREALANKDKEEALNQITKGLTLARIIERTAPACQVSATIKAGDLVYQDQDMEKMMNIPIYAELGEVSVLGPIEAA